MKIAPPVFALAVLLSCSATNALAAPASPTLSNWTFSVAFRDKGPNTCSARFRSYPNEPSLILQNRPSKTSSREAFLVLGGLPPLLAAKKTSLFDIKLDIGAVHLSGLIGTWALGNSDKNSSVAIDAGATIGTMLGSLPNSGHAVLAIKLAGHTLKYAFDLSGSANSVKMMKPCVRS